MAEENFIYITEHFMSTLARKINQKIGEGYELMEPPSRSAAGYTAYMVKPRTPAVVAL